MLRYGGGMVTILDRRKLERVVCPCYRTITVEKRRLWR